MLRNAPISSRVEEKKRPCWSSPLSDSRFASNLGPTSASCTSLCDVFAKTWCLMTALGTRTKASRWGQRVRAVHGRLLRTHRKLTKSFSFANVITLLASSFGTGKSARRIPMTLSPSFVENPSNIRLGYCSETVLVAFEETSCRRVTLCRVRDKVGPWGRWEMIMASGRPRVS